MLTATVRRKNCWAQVADEETEAQRTLNRLPQAAWPSSRAGVSAQSRLTPMGTDPRLGIQHRAQCNQQLNQCLQMGSSRACCPPGAGASCPLSIPPRTAPHRDQGGARAVGPGRTEAAGMSRHGSGLQPWGSANLWGEFHCPRPRVRPSLVSALAALSTLLVLPNAQQAHPEDEQGEASYYRGHGVGETPSPNGGLLAHSRGERPSPRSLASPCRLLCPPRALGHCSASQPSGGPAVILPQSLSPPMD